VHTARTRPGKGFEILPFAEQVKDDEPLTVRSFVLASLLLLIACNLRQMALRLTQSNPAGLDAALADVSDPRSPNYGKWLSREQARPF
jgi:hypothetical protein